MKNYLLVCYNNLIFYSMVCYNVFSYSYEYVVNLEANASSFFSRTGHSKRMINTPEDKRKRSAKHNRQLFPPENTGCNVTVSLTAEADAELESQQDECVHLLTTNHDMLYADHMYCPSSSEDSYISEKATDVNVRNHRYQIEHLLLTDAIGILSGNMKDLCRVSCPSVLRETSVSSLVIEDLVKKCVSEMSQR